jgi:uncharacterized protein YukE
MVSPQFMIQLVKFCGATLSGYKSYVDEDYVGVGANIAIGLQTLVQQGLQDLGTETMKDILGTRPTLPLDFAIGLLTALDYINGMSKPDTAPSITDGGAKPNFDAAIAHLKSALPERAQWSGKAADEYQTLIQNMQACLEGVQAADKDLHDAVKRQADMVMKVRWAFHITKVGLVAMYAPAWAIYASVFLSTAAAGGNVEAAQLAATAATRKFQFVCIGTALTAETVSALTHMQCVTANATEMMATVVPKYAEAKGKVQVPTPKALRTAAPSTPAPITVGAFPKLPGAGAAAYPVAGAAGDSRRGAAATQEPAHAQAPRASGASDSLGEPPLTTPEPAPTAAAMPAFTMATQAAKLAKSAAEPINQLVDKVTGAAKEAAAKDTHRDVAPKAPKPDGAGAGAAVGAEGAERAPVDGSTTREPATSHPLDNR